MTSRQIIKLLEEDGWFLSRIKGSHHQYEHPTKPGTVTVKHPQYDVPIKVLQSIEQQTGIQITLLSELDFIIRQSRML